MILHTIPLNDGAIHCAQETCLCKPLVRGDDVVVHHAQDCREKQERAGIVKSDGWVIIGEANEKDQRQERR